MATLTIRTKDGQSETVTLFKRLTSIGSGRENDVVVDDSKIPESALHISFDGEKYQMGSLGAPFRVNGQPKEDHALSAGDVVELGSSQLLFSETDASEAKPEPESDLASMRRLAAFSGALLRSTDIDKLLETLMDEIIELSRADKGFLILLENGQMRVKVARNLSRGNIEGALERVSDSIVRKVIETSQPIIVSEAMGHPEFGSSESVVNLKLLSVMCLPLMQRGELFGLIYLGNDKLANRFEERMLNVLSVYSASASLILQNALLLNDLRLDNTELKRRLDDQRYGDIVGACAGMKEVYKRIDKIAVTDISVLITGETGTGKELIAREIHRRSPRAKGPFMTINCGAIPENLLETELFGHVKGAFTGATATKVGKFQAANGGTLFLDEIGEMPLQLQVKILRALQDRVISKVGDTRSEPLDIRVLAATNKILEEEVKNNNFREDLYYRLNVVTLHLPPLRERGDDLLVLAKYFISQHSREFGSHARGFTPAAAAALRRYSWPGNIRELENRVKRAVILSDKALLGPDDLDLRAENLDPIMPLAQAKEEFQRRYINEVLERNNGNRTKTAKDLGVDPRTIFRHLEKLDTE